MPNQFAEQKVLNLHLAHKISLLQTEFELIKKFLMLALVKTFDAIKIFPIEPHVSRGALLRQALQIAHKISIHQMLAKCNFHLIEAEKGFHKRRGSGLRAPAHNLYVNFFPLCSCRSVAFCVEARNAVCAHQKHAVERWLTLNFKILVLDSDFNKNISSFSDREFANFPLAMIENEIFLALFSTSASANNKFRVHFLRKC